METVTCQLFFTNTILKKMSLDLIGVLILIVCIIWLIRQDGASIEQVINHTTSSVFTTLKNKKNSKDFKTTDSILLESSSSSSPQDLKRPRTCLLQCHDQTAIPKEHVFYAELNVEPFLDTNGNVWIRTSVESKEQPTVSTTTEERVRKDEEASCSDVFLVLKKEIIDSVRPVIPCPYFDINISYYDDEWKHQLLVVNDHGVEKMFRTILQRQRHELSSPSHLRKISQLPHETTNQFDEVIVHRCEIIVHILPLHDSRPFLNMGKRYMESGNYEKAIFCFTKAIERDLKEAHLYRGECYIDSKEKELEGNILEDFTIFIESCCENSSHAQYLGYLVRGSFHHDMGNYHAALEDLIQVMNHVTYSTWAHLLLALLFKDMRQYEKSIQEISCVNCQLDPSVELKSSLETKDQEKNDDTTTKCSSNAERQNFETHHHEKCSASSSETFPKDTSRKSSNSHRPCYLSHDLFVFPSVITKLVRRDGELGFVFSKLLAKSKRFDHHQATFSYVNQEQPINVN